MAPRFKVGDKLVTLPGWRKEDGGHGGIQVEVTRIQDYPVGYQYTLLLPSGWNNPIIGWNHGSDRYAYSDHKYLALDPTRQTILDFLYALGF